MQKSLPAKYQSLVLLAIFLMFVAVYKLLPNWGAPLFVIFCLGVTFFFKKEFFWQSLCFFIIYAVIDLIAFLFKLCPSLSLIELVIHYFLFNLLYSSLKVRRFRILVAFIPYLLWVVIHDGFYFIYGSVIRHYDLLSVDELLPNLSLAELLVSLIFILLPIFIVVAKLNFRSPGLIVLVVLMLCAVAVPSFFPGFSKRLLEVNGRPIFWDEYQDVRMKGRTTMLLYRFAQAAEFRKGLSGTLAGEKELSTYLDSSMMQKINASNVHIVVLESFYLPHWFEVVKEDLSEIRISNTLLGFANKSRSPVIGGFTPQAEFEILCGVPALNKFSNVEFTYMSGKTTYCLPEILKRAGYRTMVSYPYSLTYFNALLAYKSMGVGEVYTLPEYNRSSATYLVGDDLVATRLYDGSLLRQNLEFIRKQKGPYLNYVLGIYGHHPYQRNLEKRPNIWQSDSAPSHFLRSMNQNLYRLLELSSYLKDLMIYDPNSIIIVIGDHMPPFGRDIFEKYKYLSDEADPRFLAPLLLYQNKEPIKFNKQLNHYNSMAIVLNYLTSGEYCKNKYCDYLREEDVEKFRIDSQRDYITLLSLAH